ncbi:MAG: peroxide stress protein YaaA [Lactimicrobium sp.]|uniref:peroxide stress protein YaaA n=1 Tax=Lactimicrobium sp. TaxID=2563780 RepID=UPI002F35C052
MIVILSPAMRMIKDDGMTPLSSPIFPDQTKKIDEALQQLSLPQLAKVWLCSEKAVQKFYQAYLQEPREKEVTPAILSFAGIAYQYLGPSAFTDEQFAWVQNHVRILSGYYGVLKPMDGVVPYRLEMKSPLSVGKTKDLYAFWQDSLYQNCLDDDHVILNLASKEYSKAVEHYCTKHDRFVNVYFEEHEKGRYVTKGVYAKMARGDMTAWLAEKQVDDVEMVKQYDRMHYHFDKARSDDTHFHFVRESKVQG